MYHSAQYIQADSAAGNDTRSELPEAVIFICLVKISGENVSFWGGRNWMKRLVFSNNLGFDLLIESVDVTYW